MGSSKQYNDEFKNMIVELHKAGTKIIDLNREYGIPKSTLKGWINKQKVITENDGKSITNADYQTMLKKMARLEEENEILKKAMAIFAKK